MNPPATDSSSRLLDCRSVSVRFGGVVALDNVDFTLQPGEVHGLVGSNGAGKSTLMKVLAGAVPEYSGQIVLDGTPIRLDAPRDSLNHGIAMVFQDLSGIGALSVAENLFLGRQPTKFGVIDWSRMFREATTSLAELDIHIDVRRRLDRYPLVVRQMVEIARGLHSGARILILDEPTSALSLPETRRLFDLISRLKQRGVALVFISHFLEDVLAICDRVTILRDGRRLETRPARELTRPAILSLMVGKSNDSLDEDVTETTLPPRRTRFTLRSDAPSHRVPAKEVASNSRLAVQNLSLPGVFYDISFEVAPGELLGLYGFVGAGHQDLIHSLSGLVVPQQGTILLNGEPLKRGNVPAAVRSGVVCVAADRAQTLARRAPVAHNATLAHLRRSVGDWLTQRKEHHVCRGLLQQVGCRPPDPALRAGSLSGGNQQKVVLSKWLLGPIEVLLLEEPTRGMDIHAKAEVMALVNKQKEAGAAVILATTEPELVLAHADRILTFSRGQITREFVGEKVSKQDLMHHAEL